MKNDSKETSVEHPYTYIHKNAEHTPIAQFCVCICVGLMNNTYNIKSYTTCTHEILTTCTHEITY